MAIFLPRFVAVMWGSPATGPARRAPRSGRRLLRFALGVAGTGVGVMLLYAFENWHAERAWQRYKHTYGASFERKKRCDGAPAVMFVTRWTPLVRVNRVRLVQDPVRDSTSLN